MPLGAFKAALMGTAGATAAGDVVLLSTQTASDSASITFSSDITSTYGEYIFKFYNINPATDVQSFTFQANATDDPGGDYDASPMTTTLFRATHNEADGITNLEYRSDREQAEGTAFQQLIQGPGNGADESLAGELHLFNPASTTYVKHFYSTITELYHSDYNQIWRCAGYFNDTTAIDDIQFKMTSGNFDGKIKMWGVK